MRIKCITNVFLLVENYLNGLSTEPAVAVASFVGYDVDVDGQAFAALK